MARKRRFKQTSPDMGWIVTRGNISGTVDVLSQELNSSDEVFNFTDIDELDSVMSKDKSDWFIKRVLFHGYPYLTRSATTSLPYRICSVALHTSMDPLNQSMNASDVPIMSAPWYDSTMRILRTYNRPLYDAWQPATTEGGRLITIADDIEVYDSVQSIWGPSHIQDDFTVSNAGLVNDSSMFVSLSTCNIGGPSYSSGDTIALFWTLQVLLQKRRGG